MCAHTQSFLTLWDSMDCNPPDSSIYGILQARILECVAISPSRGSSRPRNRTWVSHITGRLLLSKPSGKSQMDPKVTLNNSLFLLFVPLHNLLLFNIWREVYILKLDGVIFAQLCEYTKNHWIVHCKLVNCMLCQFHLNKAVFVICYDQRDLSQKCKS